MQDIKDLTLDELKNKLTGWEYPVFSAAQIFYWIYKKGVLEFEKMSDLSRDLREKLKGAFYVKGLGLVKKVKSIDGTVKLLLRAKDNNFIEAVGIPTEKRLTGCISTQVGCKFSCCFCSSGASGFRRNLSCGEIIEQVEFLENNSEGRKITHLVFMGIGEPLDNYDNVLKAIRIINSPYSFNIGARRITISTSGIIPGIIKLADEDLQVELSVSLHAAEAKIRSRIMPVNKIYSLAELISACKEYIHRTRRQITFEYILIKDVNSTLQMAEKLSRIVKGLKLCKVNLIPSNLMEEGSIQPPESKDIILFRDYLEKKGIGVTLRKPRGQDIEAACGQLRMKHEKI